jgi:GrpB-like predicted nucleotidyltransferase (UPF0157 family)
MITIMPYSSDWPQLFEAERARLLVTLGALALRIDHVGSTSVPDMPSKPVIDMQVTVDTVVALAPWVRRLAGLGYTHGPSSDDRHYPFFHVPGTWPHTHHIHLCTPDCAISRATLALRDYLREHADARQAYAAEKRRLAQVFPGDTAESREAYAEGKSPLLRPMIEHALQLGYPKTQVSPV